MTKEQYLERIKVILNEASKDSELSREEYGELCELVSEDAGDRYDEISEEEIDRMEEDDLEDDEQD